MQIRRAELSNLDHLAYLFDGYRQFYKQESDVAAAKAFIEARLTQKDSTIFIAFENEMPVGFAQLYPSFSSVSMCKILILNDLFVSPALRNLGAASLLMEYCESFAKKTGAIRLALATEKTNQAGQNLYKKMGWDLDESFLYFNKSIEIGSPDQ